MTDDEAGRPGASGPPQTTPNLAAADGTPRGAELAGGLRLELAPASLIACRFHEQPTADDPAEHARQIRDAARARLEAGPAASWFRNGRRDRLAARRDERLAEVPPASAGGGSDEHC